MKRQFVLAFACLFVSSLAFAQSETLQHHNLVIGLGPALAVGKTTNYLSAAPLVRLGYGYRLYHWFQADAGFQMAFGAANNRNPAQTDFGTMQGGDHEYMIPLGGRVILPLPFKRIEASAGGGAMYLHYSETIPSSGYSYYAPTCYSCTSRGGWGGYGLGNVSYFLDSNHNFRVGTTVEFVSGSTNGQAVGDVPGTKTTDHWANISFDFGLSF